MIFIPTIIKEGTDLSDKGTITTNSTEKTWIDYSSEERNKIYRKAVKEANKVQKRMIEKYEKQFDI